MAQNTLTRPSKKNSEIVKRLWEAGVYANRKKGGFKKGYTPWNKGLEGSSWNTGKKWAEKTLVKISQGRKGKPAWNKGLVGFMAGEKNPNWKGGATPLGQRIRTSTPYLRWRNEVYERDDYTCQECGERGGKLNAHHIQPFAHFPELRFETSNGVTLCVGCHRKTDTYGARALLTTNLKMV